MQDLIDDFRWGLLRVVMRDRPGIDQTRFTFVRVFLSPSIKIRSSDPELPTGLAQ